jgi:hypothetical protein
MKLLYIYSIAIIVVLLILLFIYNMMKSSPSTSSSSNQNQNQNNPPSNNVNENSLTPSNNITPSIPSTMTTTYTPLIQIGTPATITLVLSNSSNLTNIITLNNTTTQLDYVSFLYGFPQTTTNISNIQFDGITTLYFYSLDMAAENPPRMSINMSLTGISAVDTSSPTILYPISTALASGNILTLTSGSNTLNILFPSAFH